MVVSGRSNSAGSSSIDTMLRDALLPQNVGCVASNNRLRIGDQMPSAAISALPVHASPLAAATATYPPALATSLASNPIDSATSGSARTACSNAACRSLRCATQYGAPWRMAIQRPSGSSARSSPRASVAHAHGLRYANVRAECIGHAEAAQDARAVGADLNARALLVVGGAALQHVRGDAMARQRQRAGQPADAGADDEHRAWPVLVGMDERRFGVLVGERIELQHAHGILWVAVNGARIVQSALSQAASSMRLTRQPGGSL